MIIENHHKEYEFLTVQYGKAVRWLLYSDIFEEFQSVYCVDIDIFYFREEPTLFEQHMKHCVKINLPYSNIIRKNELKKWSPQHNYFLNRYYGFSKVVQSAIKKKIYSYQLSGLHFMKTDEYFKYFTKEYRRTLFEEIIINKCPGFINHKNGFNNESYLFDIINRSGMGLPPIVEKGPYMLDYHNYNLIGFRPHHGIHLGIFRADYGVDLFHDTLLKDFYIEYMNSFFDLLKTNLLYKKLYNLSSPWIKDQFVRMKVFYDKHVLKDN